MKRKVLLIEKSPMVAAGLADLLHGGTQFEVVATASALDRIAERIIVVKPDLIVINPQTIDFSKRSSFRSLFQDFAEIPLIALVYSHFDTQWLKHFDGVIEIDDDAQKIAGKLEEALQALTGEGDSKEVYDLSDRERDVLVKLAKGMTNKAIATELHLSVHTVITHRKNIVRKTGIKSVAGLTVYAMLNNLMS